MAFQLWVQGPVQRGRSPRRQRLGSDRGHRFAVERRGGDAMALGEHLLGDIHHQLALEDEARVEDEGGDVLGLELVGQGVGEEDVGGLGLRVRVPRVVVCAVFEVWVVKVDTARHVAQARHVDDAGVRARGYDLLHEEVGEQEVANVVGGELELDAVGGLGVFF